MTLHDKPTDQPVKRATNPLVIKSCLIGGIWLIAGIILVGAAAVLPDDVLRTQFKELMSYTLGGAGIATVIIAVFL